MCVYTPKIEAIPWVTVFRDYDTLAGVNIWIEKKNYHLKKKCAFLFNFHCCMLGSVNIGAASGLELISLLLWEPKLIQHTYPYHNSDVIMSAMASQITSLTTVYRAVYSGTDQRKHQSSTFLALVRGIHQWLVNSPQKGPVTRKMFPFDDVIIMHRFVWPGLNVLIYCRNLFIYAKAQYRVQWKWGQALWNK